ncbi:hypothetical protein, partial [Clostridium sp.]|uniref:hypothetical protein n=1 Tax=Clostridium sp. TaxID=1506 RepID=UPI0025864AFC
MKNFKLIEDLLEEDGFHSYVPNSKDEVNENDEQIIRTSGSHNCGGRCVIKAHVKNGRVVRISTEDD